MDEAYKSYKNRNDSLLRAFNHIKELERELGSCQCDECYGRFRDDPGHVYVDGVVEDVCGDSGHNKAFELLKGGG